jgi:hypothetical protein
MNMAKLDPIVSEFESDEAAEAYDKWFRAQVEEGLREKGPYVPQGEVKARIRKIIEEARAASR